MILPNLDETSHLQHPPRLASEHIAGFRVINYTPYALTKEVTLTVGGNAEDVELIHNMDRFFRVLRLELRFTGCTASGAILDPQPSVLDRLITTEVLNISQNALMSRGDCPFLAVTATTFAREFERPPLLPWGEAIRVRVAPHETFACVGFGDHLKQLRVRIALIGELLTVVPTAS